MPGELLALDTSNHPVFVDARALPDTESRLEVQDAAVEQHHGDALADVADTERTDQDEGEQDHTASH